MDNWRETYLGEKITIMLCVLLFFWQVSWFDTDLGFERVRMFELEMKNLMQGRCSKKNTSVVFLPRLSAFSILSNKICNLLCLYKLQKNTLHAFLLNEICVVWNLVLLFVSISRNTFRMEFQSNLKFTIAIFGEKWFVAR